MKIRERYQTLLQLYRNRIARKSSYHPRKLNALHAAWLKELKTNGAVIIPNFLSPEKCDELQIAIDKAISEFQAVQIEVTSTEPQKYGWDRPQGYSIWKDLHESDFRVFKAEMMHSYVAEFNENKGLLDIGSDYLKNDIYVKFTMCNRLQYKPENLGSGGGWHRDMVYKRGYKAMVYLTDVDAESGPFQFIPGSSDSNYHLAHVMRVDQYQFTYDEVLGLVDGDDSKIVSCIAPKGTLIIFETNMIHRGKPICEGRTRYAMTNYHNL